MHRIRADYTPRRKSIASGTQENSGDVRPFLSLGGIDDGECLDNQSPSLFAFPGILAAHTVGLGLLAGLNSALDLRLLGLARSIPPTAFVRLLPVMWLGLWVNVLSGIALLVAYATKALTHPLFYLKLGLIAVALAILRSIVRRQDEDTALFKSGT